jgi:hypothetical protein
MRLVQTQVCPGIPELAVMAPLTAASRSASSKTMKGAWPPSSIETRFTVSAHCFKSRLPTSVLPVKESFRTVLLAQSSPPIALAPAVDDVEDPLGHAGPLGQLARASAE